MGIQIDAEPYPQGMIDLASAQTGGKVLWSSDDFFADASNLLNPEPAVFDSERYTERGKWMDGWESRRRRTPGHDTAIIALGIAGQASLININTAHFTGNYPAFARVWGCDAPEADLNALRTEVHWCELVPSTALKGGSTNLVTPKGQARITHIKLDIFPAGGVARLRIFGHADLSQDHADSINLISDAVGGRAIACSDMYFSEMHNLLKTSAPTDMGDGWETKRSRPPGDDWVIIQLPKVGIPKRLEVDTAFFKGNYPQSFSMDTILWPNAEPWQLLTMPIWSEVIHKQKLGPDAVHAFEWPNGAPISHIRLRIYPDGGISRLRLMGQWQTTDAVDNAEMNALNTLTPAERAALFETCCGARRWVDSMVNSGPFLSHAHLNGLAEANWWALDESDWLEAFTHHPRIGEDKLVLKEKFAATASLSVSEQSGVDDASEAMLDALVEQNANYHTRYGFIFIVCAQGKSAEEMLALLESRIHNPPEEELRIAAGEQAKITGLRLRKALTALLTNQEE